MSSFCSTIDLKETIVNDKMLKAKVCGKVVEVVEAKETEREKKVALIAHAVLHPGSFVVGVLRLKCYLYKNCSSLRCTYTVVV